jgi:glucose dehydrogenase
VAYLDRAQSLESIGAALVLFGIAGASFGGLRSPKSPETDLELWSYQPKLDPLTKKVLFSPYSRGVAVGDGKVFIGTVDGRGIALDQKTGKEIWQVQLTDFQNCHGCNFTSTPSAGISWVEAGVEAARRPFITFGWSKVQRLCPARHYQFP